MKLTHLMNQASMPVPAGQELAEGRLEAGGAGPGEPHADHPDPLLLLLLLIVVVVVVVSITITHMLSLSQNSLEVVRKSDQPN